MILGAIFNATYQEMSLGKLEGRSGDMIAILKKTLGNDSDLSPSQSIEDSHTD